MQAFWAVLFVIIAGVINGSFALFSKHVPKWRFENIWLNYALWAFLLLPWLSLYLMSPHAFSVYGHIPGHLWLVILIGGIIFGLGQVCFALAMRWIGIGLGFVINIGLGTGLGFFLPLVIQHVNEIWTPFGIATLIGTLCVIVGLLFSYQAGALRDRQHKETTSNKSNYIVGVLLAIFAGLSSAGQNLAFSLTHPMQNLAIEMHVSKLPAAFIMWPGFLTVAFIPYATYMILLHVKNNSFQCYRRSGISLYYLFAIVMAAFWFGSLIFYSKASQLIGALGPIVAWPLFMVLIILTSNFWGWYHREWANCNPKVIRLIWAGIIGLVIAVIVLAYSTHLSV